MKLKQIQSDERGSISLLEEGFKNLQEVTVFHTYAGFARGGCVHNIHDEHVCVVEGVIEYFCYDEKGLEVKKQRLFQGDTIKIKSRTPHYFIAMLDSVVMEWGATPGEKKEKHKETRKIVDKINEQNESSRML